MIEPKDLPSTFYRVSVKALILNENKEFLLCKEENWRRDMPWWWLDHWETPHECIIREVKEETGMTVTFIDKNPSYFLTGTSLKWYPMCMIVYYITVEDLNITPSEECVEIWFFNKETVKTIDWYSTTLPFAKLFDPNNH